MDKKITSLKQIFASAGDMTGEVDLIWNPVNGATGYVIEVKKENSKGDWKQVDIVTKSHYTVSGLKGEKHYRFRIAPITGNGQHSWSEPVIQKTA